MKNILRSLFKEQVAEYIASQYPSPRHLLSATEQELQALDIKKPEKAKLLSFVNFSKELLKPQEGQVIVKSPEDVFRYLQVLSFYNEERFIGLYLNTKNMIVDQVLISKGSINSTVVHPRELFCHAVRLQCSGVIACHAHPSGDPEASVEDIETTKRLVSAGEILGIKLLDHIVIGMGKYVSMKERGLM